jgi:hypothetical protein
MMHILPGQGDYHPAKNEFHGGEQVPMQGIIILMLETNLTGKPENFTSRSKNLPDKITSLRGKRDCYYRYQNYWTG